MLAGGKFERLMRHQPKASGENTTTAELIYRRRKRLDRRCGDPTNSAYGLRRRLYLDLVRYGGDPWIRRIDPDGRVRNLFEEHAANTVR
jgi:hypothetical protein